MEKNFVLLSETSVSTRSSTCRNRLAISAGEIPVRQHFDTADQLPPCSCSASRVRFPNRARFCFGSLPPFARIGWLSSSRIRRSAAYCAMTLLPDQARSGHGLMSCPCGSAHRVKAAAAWSAGACSLLRVSPAGTAPKACRDCCHRLPLQLARFPQLERTAPPDGAGVGPPKQVCYRHSESSAAQVRRPFVGDERTMARLSILGLKFCHIHHKIRKN